MHRATPTGTRQVWAKYNQHTITVYQAYSQDIADAALEAGTFVSPFKLDRMTWIKPSSLWMMYRSGWASKQGQERILSIELHRSGFEWALSHSALTHFDPNVYASRDEWLTEKAHSPVRVQWDPDRSLSLDPLVRRAIQVGISGEAVTRYVTQCITNISDITDLARKISDLVASGCVADAKRILPVESRYTVPKEIMTRIGCS